MSSYVEPLSHSTAMVTSIGGLVIECSTIAAALFLLHVFIKQGPGKLRVRMLLGMVSSDFLLGCVHFYFQNATARSKPLTRKKRNQSGGVHTQCSVSRGQTSSKKYSDLRELASFGGRLNVFSLLTVYLCVSPKGCSRVFPHLGPLFSTLVDHHDLPRYTRLTQVPYEPLYHFHRQVLVRRTHSYLDHFFRTCWK